MRARLGSTLLSLALHAALLLLLGSESLPRIDLIEPGAIAVKILPPAVPAPPAPKAAPAETAPAAAEAAPPRQPEPPKPPEQKIPLPPQVVSPSGRGVEKPPEETRFVSDRDTTVEEQMAHRGVPRPGKDDTTQEARKKGGSGPAPDARRPEPVQVASLPRLEQLLPSALEIAAAELARQEESGEAESRTEERRQRNVDIAFPPSDVYGTLDILPDVQSGDITLLNTKAALFAPFVRRVGLRVFQNLVILLRRELARFGQSGVETVTIEAVMSVEGDLVATEMTQHSRQLSLGTDRLLQRACREGFFDRNPPPGAETSDGRIHFLFRTHVLPLTGPNGVQYGYRIAFQAGLL